MVQLGSTPNVFAVPDLKGGVSKVVTAAPSSDVSGAATPKAGDLTGTHLTILGWGVLLIALYGLNHTTTGHELIYYSMVLIVLFLFIGNYNKILPLLTKGG